MYTGKRVKDLLAILHVLYALWEEGYDVLIFQTIIDFLALSARLDKLHLPRTAQEVGNRGFADPNRFRQSVNIQLAICQRCLNAGTACIAEGAEQFYHTGGCVFVKKVGGMRVQGYRLIYKRIFRCLDYNGIRSTRQSKAAWC